MTGAEAVKLLVKRFPVLKERVDHPSGLFEMPHVTVGLLATEVLENGGNETLLDTVSQFIDELANSGDDLLEELLIIDVLEGSAQNPDLAKTLRTKIGPKAVEFLDKVEREYFGR